MAEEGTRTPVAVVTGGAQGIGAGICRRLARDGYEVVILDRDKQGAERMAQETGGRSFACDVADADAVREAAEATGPVDALVNNAGFAFAEPILSSTDAQLEAVVGVNLMGALHCARAFAPAMMARGGGSIVNISSGSVVIAAPGYGIYPATKAAVEMLTRILAQEWGPSGIRVNAIGPGAIRTENNTGNFTGERHRLRETRIPLRRTGETADIADAVASLCSHDMRYVTGQIIYVDGGLSAGAPGL